MTEVVGTFFTAPKICWRKIVVKLTAKMEALPDGETPGVLITDIKLTIDKWCICDEEKPELEDDDPKEGGTWNIDFQNRKIEYEETFLQNYCKPCPDPTYCTCKPKDKKHFEFEFDDIEVEWEVTEDDDGVPTIHISQRKIARALVDAMQDKMRDMDSGYDPEEDDLEDLQNKLDWTCKLRIIPPPPDDGDMPSTLGGPQNPNEDLFEHYNKKFPHIGDTVKSKVQPKSTKTSTGRRY